MERVRGAGSAWRGDERAYVECRFRREAYGVGLDVQATTRTARRRELA